MVTLTYKTMHIQLTDHTLQSQFNTSCHIKSGGFLLLELVTACLIGLLITYVMAQYEAQRSVVAAQLVKRWDMLNRLEYMVIHNRFKKRKKQPPFLEPGTSLHWQQRDEHHHIGELTARWYEGTQEKHISYVARIADNA